MGRVHGQNMVKKLERHVHVSVAIEIVIVGAIAAEKKNAWKN